VNQRSTLPEKERDPSRENSKTGEGVQQFATERFGKKATFSLPGQKTVQKNYHEYSVATTGYVGGTGGLSMLQEGGGRQLNV